MDPAQADPTFGRWEPGAVEPPSAAEADARELAADQACVLAIDAARRGRRNRAAVWTGLAYGLRADWERGQIETLLATLPADPAEEPLASAIREATASLRGGGGV